MFCMLGFSAGNYAINDSIRSYPLYAVSAVIGAVAEYLIGE